MALTLVIVAIAVVSASAHPVLRDATSTTEPVWLRKSAEVSAIQPENAITPFIGAPSHVQAVHVLEDTAGNVFSPVSADFSPLTQPAGVRLINSANDLYRVAPSEDGEFSNVIFNPAATELPLALRASGFANALLTLLVDFAHLLLHAVPSSRAPVHDEMSNSSAKSGETWGDISCRTGFVCSAQPATHATAKQINSQYPNALVWDATPTRTHPFSPAAASKLIKVSAPVYAPFSVVEAPPASPLSLYSAIV